MWFWHEGTVIRWLLNTCTFFLVQKILNSERHFNRDIFFLSIGKTMVLMYFCWYNLWTFPFQGNLTYGKIGEWRFDKRSYGDRPPPKNLPLPPAGVPESVVWFFVHAMTWCFVFWILSLLYSSRNNNTNARNMKQIQCMYLALCIYLSIYLFW